MDMNTAPPLLPRLAPGTPSDRLLASNLAAISACDLDLAKRLSQARPEIGTTPIQVRPAASGAPTVIAGSVHIHSAFDPVAEARLQASRVPADAARVLCLGFGAAPLLSVLLERPGLGRLDVVVLHAGVLRAVAESIDLKPLLCDHRLRFVPDDQLRVAGPVAIIPPLLKLPDARFPAAREAAQDVLDHDAQQLRLGQAADQAAANLQQNQALAAADAPVSKLANRHRGSVFLVAADGPSLATHVAMLQRLLWTSYRQRTRLPLLLVAVDEALGLLLQSGVFPDYVVSLNPAPAGLPGMLRLFRAAPKEPTCLVYSPAVPPGLVQSWPGPRLVATIADDEQFAALRKTHPGSDLWARGAALHLAVDLSRHLGATAAVLLGADLSQPDAGAAGTRPTPRRVMGVTGEPVAAHGAQSTCRRALEGYLAQRPTFPVYNTSASGARIAGTTELSLQKALVKLKVTDA